MWLLYRGSSALPQSCCEHQLVGHWVWQPPAQWSAVCAAAHRLSLWTTLGPASCRKVPYENLPSAAGGNASLRDFKGHKHTDP